jgi:plasmid stability protein
MTTITLKSIPDDLYERLKESAKANGRSLNREVLTRLEASLRSRPVDPDAFLQRLDRLRWRKQLTPLTERMLKAAKSEGRP